MWAAGVLQKEAATGRPICLWICRHPASLTRWSNSRSGPVHYLGETSLTFVHKAIPFSCISNYPAMKRAKFPIKLIKKSIRETRMRISRAVGNVEMAMGNKVTGQHEFLERRVIFCWQGMASLLLPRSSDVIVVEGKPAEGNFEKVARSLNCCCARDVFLQLSPGQSERNFGVESQCGHQCRWIFCLLWRGEP
jgi:hypothetical protein